MRIESLIGLRFLRSPRQTRSISVITWISSVGVMLGVTALIITISVMNGFRDNLFMAVTGTVPHARVVPLEGALNGESRKALLEKLREVPGIEASGPYFSRQGFIRADDNYSAVVLRGIDPKMEGEVTELKRFLRDRVRGRYELTEEPGANADDILGAVIYPPRQGRRAGIILGNVLARNLGLSMGDEVDLISTEQRMTPIGSVPLIKRFRLVGVFETGVGGTDEVTAFVDYRVAQKLYRMKDGISGISLRLSSPYDDEGERLRQAFPGYRIITWGEENKNIFQVMRLEKLGVFVILTLIILVSFFNIISSLIMLVLEKRKAIAVLKALGAGERLVRRVFLAQGLWIGILGTLAGLSLGLFGCWLLATFNIVELPPGIFPHSRHLPVRVDIMDLALITGSSFTICLLVTLYPATRAARTNVVVNLRNE